MKKEVVTLKKLAQILNLSISTVSRALNDHPDISESTREKVKNLAQTMQYVPNIFAKGFRKHRTNIIGVIVPTITHYFTTLKKPQQEGIALLFQNLIMML